MIRGAHRVVIAAGLSMAWSCAPGPERILGSIAGDDGGTEQDASRPLRPDDPRIRTAPCVTDYDCAALGLYCDVDWGECVPCTRDAHCGNARPFCHDAWRICVQCEYSADCFGGYCDVQHGICRPPDAFGTGGAGAGP